MTIFFSENDPDGELFFRAAKQAVEGLFYISETDAEIVPFVLPKAERMAADIIILYADLPPDAPIEERGFDEFFMRLTASKPWHGQRETERAKKFLELKNLLEEYLTGIKVFRIGRNPIDIFVAGRLKTGSLAGVRTKAVET